LQSISLVSTDDHDAGGVRGAAVSQHWVFLDIAAIFGSEIGLASSCAFVHNSERRQ
jgi:hypothetical protein